MIPIDTIVQGDCLEVMKGIEDNSVDLVLTDPPYGVNKKYYNYYDTENSWYKLIDHFIPEAKRIGKMVIFPSCQIKRLEWFYKYYPPDWLICWHKGSTGCNSFVGFNDWEALLVYGKTESICMHDHFTCTPNEKLGNYGHPCPKPIEWATWIINRTTKEGDLILDPFLGSGTTAVACIKTNRHYIGIELSQEYCNIAQQRVDAENAQLKLDFSMAGG